MQTPYGKECRYFYGDYHRGKNHEECRLLEPTISARKWTSKLCKSCPVPSIILANACQYMVFKGQVSEGILGLGKSMKIRTFCEKSQRFVTEPQVGCGECHPVSEFLIPKK